MARLAYLVDADQERVAIAVEAHGFDILGMSRGITLAPVCPPRTRIKRDASGGEGAMQCLVIHPAEHQHVAGVMLLDDGWHQKVGITHQTFCDIPLEVTGSGHRRLRGALSRSPLRGRALYRRALYGHTLFGHDLFGRRELGRGGGIRFGKHPSQSIRPGHAVDMLPTNARFVLISAVMQFVEPSREVLAETLLAAGPNSPTLCAGWKTQDLAAHLYLREHRAAVGLGLVIPPLAGFSERATKRCGARATDAQEFEQLVGRFRTGPGRFSPLGLDKVSTSANLIEYFVHTEDVRRATDRWAPRALDGDYSDALWHELLKRAPLMYRRADGGIVLVRPDGLRQVVKRGAASVAILGEPCELLMHAHGRTRHSLVTFEGPPDAVARIKGSTPESP